jgi:NAD(P)-dependent dehydrogenase (short-subunit alcohol dehydrogenase family)
VSELCKVGLRSNISIRAGIPKFATVTCTGGVLT